MKYKLLADAGSTKVEWSLIRPDGSVAASVHTGGINAALSSPDSLTLALERVGELLRPHGAPGEVYYYGAGCATPSICAKMARSLQDIWKDSVIHVDSDMLAAARSLFSHTAGIACILGTGSNSCLYDGTGIISQIPSLGYVLGDEGSGAVLGRRLISDIFKLRLPKEIISRFNEAYNVTISDIIENVYRGTSPSGYLASFVPFLKDNIDCEEIHDIVYDGFLRFIDRNLAHYLSFGTYSVGFIGSVASHFETVLRQATSAREIEISHIYKSPMGGLIKHHTTLS